jgi:hypothetical protein
VTASKVETTLINAPSRSASSPRRRSRARLRRTTATSCARSRAERDPDVGARHQHHDRQSTNTLANTQLTCSTDAPSTSTSSVSSSGTTCRRTWTTSSRSRWCAGRLGHLGCERPDGRHQHHHQVAARGGGRQEGRLDAHAVRGPLRPRRRRARPARPGHELRRAGERLQGTLGQDLVPDRGGLLQLRGAAASVGHAACRGRPAPAGKKVGGGTSLRTRTRAPASRSSTRASTRSSATAAASPTARASRARGHRAQRHRPVRPAERLVPRLRRVSYAKGGFKLSGFTNLLDSEAPNLLTADLQGNPVQLNFNTKTFDLEVGHTVVALASTS